MHISARMSKVLHFKLYIFGFVILSRVVTVDSGGEVIFFVESISTKTMLSTTSTTAIGINLKLLEWKVLASTKS